MTRKAVTAGVLAATVALTGIGTGVSVAASRTKTHTLTFTTKQTYEKKFAHNNFADTDKDLKNGKVIGVDVATGHIDTAKQTVTGFFSIALSGGVLDSTFTINFETGELTGDITGGGGKYAGVHGTLRGVPSDKSGNNFRVTIKYHH